MDVENRMDFTTYTVRVSHTIGWTNSVTHNKSVIQVSQSGLCKKYNWIPLISNSGESERLLQNSTIEWVDSTTHNESVFQVSQSGLCM